jgi:hypothetical protein
MSRKAPGGVAGCENPATSQHVDVGIPHKVSMPVAAMAGSLSRKIPGSEKAGQAIAGKQQKAGVIKHKLKRAVAYEPKKEK